MTRLGQMIMEDGIQKGKTEGKTESIISLVRKKMAKGLSDVEIADVLEEDVSRITEIVTAIRANPKADDNTICKML